MIISSTHILTLISLEPNWQTITKLLFAIVLVRKTAAAFKIYQFFLLRSDLESRLQIEIIDELKYHEKN